MDQYKLEDLIDATKEEVGKEVVEKLLPQVIQEAGNILFDRGVGMLACQVVGSVLPVANNILLSFNQHRLERNVLNALNIIQSRQTELENRMNELLENNPLYTRQITEALLDNIVDEIQERMVDYNVNGYINLLKSDHTNIDLGLMFFKTMSQLNDLDIRILKAYSNLEAEGESIVSICNELNLELDQIRFIKEKLERFGLLQSRNEEMNDDNLKAIVKYLENVKRENRKKNPNDVKVPNLKRVSGADSYRITSLGRHYLIMIDR
ncbi:hypothetical protein [uncultured Holdemanella sp.]|uniref:hypothetical protein n=1 Tax=uncultured Holdemanella sp. TaxID=1763549 RepID=UPI0025E8D818|nr:hypothetical protein [uncultured Holdemanella sp.]